MKNNKLKIIFSALFAVMILWRFFGCGYILTMDTVFGPRFNLLTDSFNLSNSLPINYLIYYFNILFGGAVVEKIIFFSIFFLLLYFPLKYFKKIFNLENTYNVEYLVSVFYAINPFVYERLIAGQWMVLFGYALLVPALGSLIYFLRDYKYSNLLKLIIFEVLLAVVSSHIFVISILILVLAVIISQVKNGLKYDNFKKIGLLFLGIFIGCGYWIIPAIQSKTVVGTFDNNDIVAFSTANDSHIGTIGNVIYLHGFWGEHEKWVNRFILPKDNGYVFYVSFSLLLILIGIGVWYGIKQKKTREVSIFVFFWLILSIVFSVGVGDSFLKGVNTWLFDNVSFWKGFRDSEKWSSVLALSYSLFLGFGAYYVISKIREVKYRNIILYSIIALPLIASPVMLFGTLGQIKPVKYPKGWASVNSILKEDKDCKAVFLPWHMYYDLSFNNNILTANTADKYFNCDIISSQNADIGGVGYPANISDEYRIIAESITTNHANPDLVIQILKETGVRYIISTPITSSKDPYTYDFLKSKKLEKIYSDYEISLYELL